MSDPEINLIIHEILELIAAEVGDEDHIPSTYATDKIKEIEAMIEAIKNPS